MKKLFTIPLLVFSLAFFAKCSKSDNPQPQSSNSMTANIGGNGFSANEVTIGGDATFLSVWGTGSNSSVAVYIDAYKGIGTYPVGTNWTVPTQYVVSGITKYAVHGTVSITGTNPKISGTFSFTCDDSTKVINGTFSAK